MAWPARWRRSRARKAGKADTLPITERDIPIGIVGFVTLVCMLPIGWVLGYFANQSGLGAHLPTLVIGGVVYVVDELLRLCRVRLHGGPDRFVEQSAFRHRHPRRDRRGVAACVWRQALCRAGCRQSAHGIRAFYHRGHFQRRRDCEQQPARFKTGQLVDATPWKQQVALIIGVLAGALVIPPVLDLVNQAYGFVGAPGAELRPNPLPAPQAGLISSLAQGVIAADIDWSLIRIGALIGVGIIVLDEILTRTTKHMRVPPLAVGLGIYLPTASTLMIVVGTIVGLVLRSRADRTPKPEADKATWRVARIGLDRRRKHYRRGDFRDRRLLRERRAAGAGRARDSKPLGRIIGGIAFAAIAFLLYRWILRMGSKRSA